MSAPKVQPFRAGGRAPLTNELGLSKAVKDAPVAVAFSIVFDFQSFVLTAAPKERVQANRDPKAQSMASVIYTGAE